ncbi:MAG: hypothetical protein ABW086_15825 [Sedimenticola sp.]
MNFNDKYYRGSLPVYEVKELSMEEALLVMAVEKEVNEPSRKPETGDYFLQSGRRASSKPVFI